METYEIRLVVQTDTEDEAGSLFDVLCNMIEGGGTDVAGFMMDGVSEETALGIVSLTEEVMI